MRGHGFAGWSATNAQRTPPYSNSILTWGLTNGEARGVKERINEIITTFEPQFGELRILVLSGQP